MNASYFARDRQLGRATAALLLLFLVGSCKHPPNDRFQGYVEGEFVYVASLLAGTLEKLAVRCGDQAKAGDPLFALDETPEKAAREQIEAALVLSEAEYARQKELFRTGATAAQDLDRARSARDQDEQRLAQTDWSFAQKQQAVALLPPQNIKVRAFAPETRVGLVHYGDKVQVTVDGVRDPFIGRVSYISPHAEYTPPVIYSREARDKLVFMVEAVFEPAAAANLHPGQPVDVQFEFKS